MAPCVAATAYGRRAYRAGDRRGLVPAGIAVVVGGVATVATVLGAVGG